MFDVLTTFIARIALISLIWIIPLKGFSLWFSARNNHKIWFVVLLVVNTLGILEAVYLLFFSGVLKDMKNCKWTSKKTKSKKQKNKAKKGKK